MSVKAGVEIRKKWSTEVRWDDANKTVNLKELRNLDLSKIRGELHNAAKVIEIEGALLRSFQLNRALRSERSKIISLIKICEFWIGNKIKRGEALSLLEKVLSVYEPREEIDVKIIPELNKAFETRDRLRTEKPNFGKDDYYLTMEEQFEYQYERYHKLFSNAEGMVKEYQDQFYAMKEETEKKALKMGDFIKHFEYFDVENQKNVSTRDLLKKGPLVLSFFRGSWCPYCINEMCVLTDSLSRFNSLGASLLSLGPDENALKYFRKLGVIGDIGLDENLAIGRKYGLVFSMPKVMQELYEKCGIAIENFNTGTPPKRELPIPATYIIDTDGKIVFSFVKMEYYLRLDPREIVKVLFEMFQTKQRAQHETILGKRKLEFLEETTKQDEIEKNDATLEFTQRPVKKIRVFDHSKFVL